MEEACLAILHVGLVGRTDALNVGYPQTLIGYWMDDDDNGDFCHIAIYCLPLQFLCCLDNDMFYSK